MDVKALLASGRLVDVALVVIGLELVALLLVRRRAAPGLRPLDVVGQLLAGALLLLGLRCVLTGADYRYTLALLTSSFPAHVWDLARRARRSGAQAA